MQRLTIISVEERQVLRLAAEGLSVTEVAHTLGCPRERVHECLTGAFVTLGASSKLEAIIVAIRRGEL
jgi:DNA-binding NarL/FixJ family response regulator